MIASKSNFLSMIRNGMQRRIVGQKHLIDSLLIALLSNGHVLLEGVPGLAKTLAIKTLATLVDAKYNRIQFTPDLLPADVVVLASPTSCLQTRSTEHLPKCRAPCLRPCRSGR